MTELLTQNSKMRKSVGMGYSIWNFGIPAYKSADGTITCPMAGACGETGGCYALQGSYVWTPVRAAYEYRLGVTKQGDFITIMVDEIKRRQKLTEKKGLKLAIRVHDSGDFYSATYFNDWQLIANECPGVVFYAYTKMVHLVRRLPKAANFTFILSEGGKADHLIDPSTDRHSRVFSSDEELTAAGYDNATANDSVAFLSKSGKIGLVYHGYASKVWTTGKKTA